MSEMTDIQVSRFTNRSYSPTEEAPYSIQLKDERDFEVTWKNVTYGVTKSAMDRMVGKAMGHKVEKTKQILRGVSGRFKCGELTALMGPSGAGKSTLLECIVGKRETGLRGDINCTDIHSIKIAFIPQHDQFFACLTVREAMWFACRVRFDVITEADVASHLGRKKSVFVEAIVDQLLGQLGLEVCAENRIGSISGGQLKRLSIAQELIAKPNILVLDEPTSGLDSSSCHLVVELLQKLTQGTPRMAIVCTIHQPSFKVLSLFHKVYLLSKNGKCIYDGPPSSIVEHMATFGLTCPQFTNPADFLIEVASGELGMDALQTLSQTQESRFELMMSYKSVLADRPLRKLIKAINFPFFAHMWYLFVRSLIINLRDPWLFGVRLGSHVVVGILSGLLFGPDVGLVGGCFPRLGPHMNATEMIGAEVEIREQLKQTMNNAGCLFFGILFMMFSGLMPTLLTFPLEMNTFLKEKTNQWYGVGSYYLAKTLADIPFQVAFPVIYVVISYFWNHQIASTWRFFLYLFVQIAVGFIAQSHGLLIGSMLMHNMTAAVYIGPITAFPMLLVTGFFVRIPSLSQFWVVVSYSTYLRFAFESILISIYGFERCGGETSSVGLEDQIKVSLDTLFKAVVEQNCGVSSGFNGKELYHLSNQTDNEIPLSSDNSSITGQFIGTIARAMTTDFVGSGDDTMRSALLTEFGLKDEQLLRDILVLIGLFLAFRVATYVIVIRQASSTQ